ncbi:hypothetical protein D3C84_700180 [compost metagenome]
MFNSSFSIALIAFNRPRNPLISSIVSSLASIWATPTDITILAVSQFPGAANSHILYSISYIPVTVPAGTSTFPVEAFKTGTKRTLGSTGKAG